MDARQIRYSRPVRELSGMFQEARLRVAQMNRPQKRVLGGMVFFMLMNAAIIATGVIFVILLLSKLR